jgi:hypothetical protein
VFGLGARQYARALGFVLTLETASALAGCQARAATGEECNSATVIESRPESGAIEIATPEQAGSAVPLLVELSDGHLYRIVRHDGTPESYPTAAAVTLCKVQSHLYKASFYGLRLDDGVSPPRFYSAYRIR